jgi:hypothetical protein
MTTKQDQPVNLEALKKKLEVVREFLAALSPGELRALTENPNLLGWVFGAPRQTYLTDLDQKVRDHIAEVDAFGPASAPIVQVTRAQSEEARRLHMEIWKKQGIADEMIALTQLRGERIDPFADQDTEPASEKGE